MIGRTPLIPLAFAAIYLIWGSTYLAIRIGIETLPPFLMAGFRFLLAGLPFYAWLRWRGTVCNSTKKVLTSVQPTLARSPTKPKRWCL